MRFILIWLQDVQLPLKFLVLFYTDRFSWLIGFHYI